MMWKASDELVSSKYPSRPAGPVKLKSEAANVVEAKRRAIETVELEQRIAALEEAKAGGK